MINSYAAQSSTVGFSFYKLAKVAFILIGFTWVFMRIVGGLTTGYRIEAHGSYSQLQFPEYHTLRLTLPSGQVREMHSVWQFQIQNKGVKDTSDLAIQLPFEGFYKVERAGAASPDLKDFSKTINLGNLGSLENLSVVVWTESGANPDFERDSRIVHKDGTVNIEFPVMVDGFLAWLERSKAILSFVLVVMVLLYLL